MDLLFGTLSRKERRAQRCALREIRRLMRTTDMRLGQIIVNAGRVDETGTPSSATAYGTTPRPLATATSLFFCTDERWAERLQALRRRTKILAPAIKQVAERRRPQPP